MGVLPYTRRVLDDELDDLLRQLPAIVIEGPKGVGKTATAERRAATIFRLDDRAQRTMAQAHPKGVIASPPPVLIDEWQHVPELWDEVRRAVDADPTAGRFLLAGSAVGANPPSHSGAGRITSLRMRPMALAERGIETPTVSLQALLSGACPDVDGQTALSLADYAREIVRSGYPRIRSLAGRALRLQLQSYVNRIVDRDFPDQGHVVRKPDTLQRWLRVYAAATATTTSLEKIREVASASGVPPARSTVEAYRDVLQRLWIVDDVPGWSPSNNRFTRLGAAPKRHLADPALAAVMLGLDEGSLLRGTPTTPAVAREGTPIGHLFESLVTLSVRTYAQAADVRVFHLREKDGRHEVDLVLERSDGRVLGIEVKLRPDADDDDVRGLHWFKREMGAENILDLVVITTGQYAYRRTDGVAVVPAALLGP